MRLCPDRTQPGQRAADGIRTVGRARPEKEKVIVRTAVVMIARDEQRCIARALRSVAGVCDEVVVLDTGSIDDTVAIARGEGARVHTTQWHDDFSAARNQALDLADADWNLCLDADETLRDGHDFLAGLRYRQPDSVGIVTVVSVHTYDGGQAASTGLVDRLLPTGVRFAGRVHEQPQHRLPVRRTPIILDHDGYAGSVAATKRGRNETLIRAELEAVSSSDPRGAYLLYQLGKELEVDGRFEAAVDAYREAHLNSPAAAPWRHPLVIHYLYCLKRIGHFEAALAVVDAETDAWAQSPDFYFTVGDLLLDLALAQPERAQALLPLIEGSWLKCLEIGDRPGLPGSVLGSGSFLAARNLAGFYESTGRLDQARQYRVLSGQPPVGVPIS